ncbi:hypothetical protein B0H14DRAFT_3648886 [Mycena olivaceomarginata]|nr:hypothetical protein B0H14DRAFT_3648886 [Mycena olivaceomarginata]
MTLTRQVQEQAVQQKLRRDEVKQQGVNGCKLRWGCKRIRPSNHSSRVPPPVVAGLADKLALGAQHDAVDVLHGQLDDIVAVFERFVREGSRTEERRAIARTATGSSSRRMHQGGPEIHWQSAAQKSVNARRGQVGRTADNQTHVTPGNLCQAAARDEMGFETKRKAGITRQTPGAVTVMFVQSIVAQRLIVARLLVLFPNRWKRAEGLSSKLEPVLANAAGSPCGSLRRCSGYHRHRMPSEILDEPRSPLSYGTFLSMCYRESKEGTSMLHWQNFYVLVHTH